jgi:hypothetical protein
MIRVRRGGGHYKLSRLTEPAAGRVGVPIPDGEDPDVDDDGGPVEPDVDGVVPDEPELPVVDVVPPAPAPTPVVDEPEPVAVALPVVVELLPLLSVPVVPRPVSVPVAMPVPPVASAPPLETVPAFAAPPLDDWADETEGPVASLAFEGDGALRASVVAGVDGRVIAGAYADPVLEFAAEAAGASSALPEKTA